MSPTYDFAKFSQKLERKIESIWTRGGGVPRAPLRSAPEFKFFHFMQFSAESLQNNPTLGVGGTSGKFLIIHCYSLCQDRILCVLDFPLAHGGVSVPGGLYQRVFVQGVSAQGVSIRGSLSRGSLCTTGMHSCLANTFRNLHENLTGLGGGGCSNFYYTDTPLLQNEAQC